MCLGFKAMRNLKVPAFKFERRREMKSRGIELCGRIGVRYLNLYAAGKSL
jgi:hypothetical protein